MHRYSRSPLVLPLETAILKSDMNFIQQGILQHYLSLLVVSRGIYQALEDGGLDCSMLPISAKRTDFSDALQWLDWVGCVTSEDTQI